jgi:hypothetical protein
MSFNMAPFALLASGLSAKLMPKALEQLFAPPTTFVDFFF